MRVKVTPTKSHVLEASDKLELHVCGEHVSHTVTVCPGFYQIKEELRSNNYGEKYWKIHCVRIGRGAYARLSTN